MINQSFTEWSVKSKQGVYTKQEVDDMLAECATKEVVEDTLEDYATKDDVDDAIAGIGAALPTTDPAEAGALWNDSGAVKVSAG